MDSNNNSIEQPVKRQISPLKQYTYEFWEDSVLNRYLKNNEKKIIHRAKSEFMMNQTIKSISNRIAKDNLYIPCLTPNDGNCLFHSLLYHGLAKDIESLKLRIINILLFFKNEKKLLLNQDGTIGELFMNFNEIENVWCHNENTMFKYTYDMMCLDMLSDDGWTRCNTELILRIIAVALNVNIIIHKNETDTFIVFPDEDGSDNSNDTEKGILSTEAKKRYTIHLVHVNENHYVPADVIKNSEELGECPRYTEELIAFQQWAIQARQQAKMDREEH